MTTDVTYAEHPVYLEAGEEHCFAVYTSPMHKAPRFGVLMAPGSGWMPAMNRNRSSVRLARRFAAAGAAVLRMEYHGVGESSGTIRGYSLRRPYVRDVRAGIRWLRERGFDDLILVGNCYGTRALLASIDDGDPVRAIVLITPPVYNSETQKGPRHQKQARLRLRDAPGRARAGPRIGPTARAREVGAALARWAIHRLRAMSPDARGERLRGEAARAFTASIRRHVARGVPILMIFGDKDGHLERFTRAKQGALGAVLRQGGSQVDVRILSGHVHGFSALKAQTQIVELVGDWVANVINEGLVAAGNGDSRRHEQMESASTSIEVSATTRRGSR